MIPPDHLERHLERLVELFHSSTISQSMGMTLHYDDEQRAVFELPYDGRFDHFLDDVHGGAIATMIDNAGWFAAAACYPTWIVSVEFHVRYHEPAGKQKLTAIGSIVRAGKRITSTAMEVRNEQGVLVATGTGSFAVTSSPHPTGRGAERGSGRQSSAVDGRG
jgi:uncharacterized protein (TIGR00369 family)